MAFTLRALTRSSLLSTLLLAAPALAEDAPVEPVVEDDLLAQLDELTVILASQQEEPLREAPGPVTVVDREAIRAIGARNLQEVLITLVPGMTLIEDHNEANVAMRGVYSSSQQKVLVLLNGHRLNSRVYAMAAPDHSIGLDKVERIEILRGPGSSVYGNVALTAVINIVTRDPKDLDGAQVSVEAGNFGQMGASVTFGRSFADRHSVLFWGEGFFSEGQRRAIPVERDYSVNPQGGFAIVEGYRDPGSYDLGLQYRVGSFTLLANSRHGKLSDAFTSSGVTGQVYDYDAYRSINGVRPGVSSRSNHLELKFARALGEGWDLELSAYYDTNDLDASLGTVGATNSGLFLSWRDDDYGAQALARYGYVLPAIGKGSVTFGTQFEQMRLLDSFLAAQSGGEFTGFGDTSANRVITPGRETSYSGFLQVKQALHETVIVNGGVRYDVKDRFRGDNVGSLSPRLALIWSPTINSDIKLSYAESFVDAPYWYRYNSLASYRGAEALTPEHLRSLQLTPTVILMGGRLVQSLNVFYNHLYDFVFRNNAAVAPEPFYQNAGELQTIGVEEELSFKHDYFAVRANATYQHLLAGRDYGTRGDAIFNVPKLVANASFDVTPIQSLREQLALNVTVRYVGAQLSPIDIRYVDATGNVLRHYDLPDNTVDAYVLANLGVRVTDLPVAGLSLDATVYNLFDTEYFQGGSTLHPYPRMGRSFLVKLSYAFAPEF